MDMLDRKTAIDLARDQIDFAAQRLLVNRDRLVATGDGGVAAAIPAHRPAERHMEVERTVSRRFGIAFSHSA